MQELYARAEDPDVAEKILQTQTYWERKRIDYFLILTPLAGISNDLDHFIQTANSAETFLSGYRYGVPRKG